ncbi:MAG: GntR family transcriptional regulator [Armatimonadetes bacterium]|nr:GntR family transcriptional regulator [Armatimonadota bacterium]
MRFTVDRRGATSLTDQLKAQIRHQILSGRLAAGTRLPPVRTLAGFLRVNRNTVARAYAELEAEGVLDARPGRGTFVVWTPPQPQASRALAAQIDRLLATASAAGLDLDDLVPMLALRATRRRGMGRPRLGFVECNPVDLAYFARLVRESVDVPVATILLADLTPHPENVDLLATTFFHVEEVRRRCAEVEVVGLMALPDFRTLDEVAHLPRTSRVGLVCATAEGVRSKARSLEAVGLGTPRLATATLDDPGSLASLLERSDVILAAPRVLERIKEAIPASVRVIPFASVLSDGAVALLHERIAAWRLRQLRASA